MDAALRQFLAEGEGMDYDVSILVLVDAALRPDALDDIHVPKSEFQSLF